MFDNYDWPTQFRSYSPDNYANPYSNIKGSAVGKDFARAVESTIRELGFLGVDDLIRKPGGGKSRVGLEVLQSVISGLAPYYNTTMNLLNNREERMFNVPQANFPDTNNFGANIQPFLNNLFNNIRSEFQSSLNNIGKSDLTNTAPFYGETKPQFQPQQMPPSQRVQSQQISPPQQPAPSSLQQPTPFKNNNIKRDEPEIFII